VSTVLGIGRQLRLQPRANPSITIMRAPQRIFEWALCRERLIFPSIKREVVRRGRPNR
jgi:hypothetical protein